MYEKEISQETIKTIKEDILNCDFDSAVKDILAAMVQFPHSAAPHNFMGILMEHEDNHDLAMKHFRAACALDPTFRPAKLNLQKYGGFDDGKLHRDAYNESDCQADDKGSPMLGSKAIF